MSPDNHKSKRKPQRKAPDEPEFRFINHSLTREQAEDLAGLFEAGEWSFDNVLDEVAAGYDFKVGGDRSGGGFRAHLICRIPGHADQNACLSGRGSTAIDAIYALLYRHLVLAPDGWQAISSDGDSQSRFG